MDLRRSNKSLAALSITQMVVRLSPLISGFCSRPVHMELVVDGVAVGHVFERVLRISSVSIIPLMLHTHSFVTDIFFNSLKHPLSVSFHIPSVSLVTNIHPADVKATTQTFFFAYGHLAFLLYESVRNCFQLQGSCSNTVTFASYLTQAHK